MKRPIQAIEVVLGSINNSVILMMMLISCSSISTKQEEPQKSLKEKAPAAQEAIRVDPQYRVGPNTKLSISVYNEPDLTEEVVVLPDGMINYSYVGKIKVGGLSPKQIERKLYNLLDEEYLVFPQVTVKVKEWGIVYIFGKVKNPGILKVGEQQNALQMVAAAGGFGEGAKHKVIEVIRTENNEKKIFTLPLLETKGKGLELAKSLFLLPGDTLIVE